MDSTSQPMTTPQLDKQTETPFVDTDTFILIASCTFMIIIGLVLRKLFLHFVRVRQRRERYLEGLKALGDHMQMVTRRISIAPNSQRSYSSVNSVESEPQQIGVLRASKRLKTSRVTPDAESVWISRTLEIKNRCFDS